MTDEVEPIILFGSCQVAVTSWILHHCPTLRTRYSFHRYYNFPDRSAMSAEVPMEMRARCPVFIHAMGAWGRESEAFVGLPDHTRIVHIPTPFTSSLFPLSRPWPEEPPLKPRTVEMVWDLADKLAIELIESGLSKTDYMREYFATDLTQRIDCNRFHELDLFRLRQQDAWCDFPIADYVEQRFRSHRIFYTLGHLSNEFHFHMARETFEACIRHGVPFMVDNQDAIRADLAEFERTAPPLHSETQVPVHPQVAEMLRLEWFDPNYVYDNRASGAWTFRAYIDLLYDYVKSAP